MSDTESKEESQEQTPPPLEEISHSALDPISELEDLEDLEKTPEKAPSLKEMLQSTDTPSRYLSILAILFTLLGIFCLALLTFEYLKYRHSMQKPEVKKVEPVVEIPITQDLGEFQITWDHAELRVQVVAECSNHEACDHLKEHLDQARDSTLPLLQASSRDEILNPEKKQYLRQKIADQLSDLKLGGKVTSVNFTDMTVEVNH